jgi:hypothetical protein
VTRETEEEVIQRRSENAEGVFALLYDAYEWFWILAGIVIGLGLLAFWALG